MSWKRPDFSELAVTEADDFRCARCARLKPMADCWISTEELICAICDACKTRTGRPKLDVNQPTVRVSFTLTKKDHRKIKQAAKKMGVGVSEYIRRIIAD